MSGEMAEAKRTIKVPARLVASGVGILLLVVLGALGAAYVIRQKPEILGLSKGTATAAAEVGKLTTEVGKLIALPTDEKPTVATVTDVDKLKEQAFFKNAANGDKVLIYTNARKAILYRPTEKRIIEVGAININQATPTPTPEEETPEG